MSLVENPGIPLVGLNGKLKKYKTLENETVDAPPGRFETVGSRLARRKELFVKRKRSSDVALIFALVGILLMVVQTELTAAKVYPRSSLPSHLMKMAITASTVALLIFLGIYHRLDIQLFIVNNSVDDWRIAMTARRITQMTVEFIVCSIHPIPGNFYTTWPATVAEGERHRSLRVPLDTILALPMFLRLFLVCRFIMLHSKLYEDASSQSLGALNRIHFNFRFIFKSLMTMHPDYVLTVIMIVSFLIASWALRMCEMSDSSDESVHSNFLNTMWLVAITFLSVGYGDIKPSTYCGRGITVITGMMGAGCTALVVAVLARKLELSRSEKYVHDFVLDVDLDKRLKHEAANVMKSGWFIYKFRKVKVNTSKALKYQTKLLEAIYNIRQIKAAQRRLLDASVTLTEMNKSQNETSRSVELIRCKQLTLEEKVDNIESKIMSLHDKLNFIHKALRE
ncbi:small conductance calcium-activated potassium channel protein-like [Saccostrea cucullata]|uniref:small conductance calcium-activated potassium channel protein-like n=1 Tax=Saccostrea cuccullata TaxID=36930 RepID=UPI002ED10119